MKIFIKVVQTVNIQFVFFPLTSVTPLYDNYYVSNLNTCKTNAVKTRGITSFNENKDIIVNNLEKNGIPRNNLDNFINKFQRDKRHPMDLLNKCLEKLRKECTVSHMNYNGHRDKDFYDVRKDTKTNLLYQFTENTGYNMDIWGNNRELKTTLHDSQDEKTANFAKNLWEFFKQGEKSYELTDFEFLKEDTFIESCQQNKNNNDEFTIYDEKGELNETGQLITKTLCEKFSPRIESSKIWEYLKDDVVKGAVACRYNCSEIGDYIEDVCRALIIKLNEDKLFFPEEIYTPIKTKKDGSLDDSFAGIQYFQSIVTAFIMYFLNEKSDKRKNMITGIVKFRDDFEKITDFPKSEYALNLLPKEKTKFIIEKFYGNKISEEVFEKLLNTTTAIYADLFSPEARNVMLHTDYHTTQFIFLNSQHLFIEKNGEVKVPFPILYEIIMGEKLNLSSEVKTAYENFDTSNPETFDFKIKLDNLGVREINAISTENLVKYVASLNSSQLNLLSIEKIYECIFYVQNPESNYSTERKNHLLKIFVNIKSNFINYLTSAQIVVFYEYLDINHRNIGNDKLIDLVNYIKSTPNSTTINRDLVRTVFKLLTNNNQIKRDFAKDQAFFVIMVEFQDVIEFDKFFERRYDRFKSMIAARNDDSNNLLNNFLRYLADNIKNDKVQRLIRGPFLNLYSDNFLKIAQIEDVLNFFRDIDEKAFSKFPSERVKDLLNFIRRNTNSQDTEFANTILMQKINYYPEFILDFSPEEIAKNYNAIGARTLKYLNVEKFTDLINYFLVKKSIGYEWLKKLLATSVLNKNLFKSIQPQQIFDLIIYCKYIVK